MISILPVCKNQYRETEELYRDAFWNVYSPGCTEYYLAHVLRSSSDYLPKLDRVLSLPHGGGLIGAAMCIRASIAADDGRTQEVLTLGPVAIRPGSQGEGYGRYLVKAMHFFAGELGYRAMFLTGDPAFYSKLGFRPAETFGIRTAENQYMDALMPCELTEGALDRFAGRYLESSSYQIGEAAALAFDRDFPPREPISGTPTQRRFLELAARVRPYPD